MLPQLLAELNERFKLVGAASTGYGIVVGAFLYLFGYLALRFHLTAIGLETDIPLLDERYLFTGASFVVYVASCVPGIVLLVLPFFGIGWVVSRLLPSKARVRVAGWLTAPVFLIPLGIVFSVVVIEFVMSPCFRFTDLLLGRELPRNPAWFATLMYESQYMTFYFGALVAACVLPVGILILLRSQPNISLFSYGLLAFLAAVQIMLLPINYGVLVVDKSLPRVASMGGRPLTEGQTAWLVWQGRPGATFLVRQAAQDQRSLLTLDSSELKDMEIVGYDEIVPTLFGNRYVRGRDFIWRLRETQSSASPRSFERGPARPR